MNNNINSLSNRITIKVPDQYENPVMAVRVTGWRYCNDFVNKGIIHFSNVETWRDKTKSKYGQLDEDEGCFCKSLEDQDKLFDSMGLNYKKENENGIYKYYYDNDSLLGVCFYGIMLSEFGDEVVTPFGTKQRRYTVSSDYFSDFYPELTKENYDVKSDNKQPGVIFIYDFVHLQKLIIQELIRLGFSREEVILGPAFYCNKTNAYYMNMQHPLECFLKDAKYERQHEFRIILNSSNKSLLETLKNQGNNICIGNLIKANIATLQTFYFDDFDLAIQGDKLIYKLAEPKVEHIRDMDFKELAYLALETELNILPQGKFSEKDQDKLLDNITKVLQEKYGIQYQKTSAVFGNITKDQYDLLPEWYKEQRPFWVYPPEIVDLLNNGKTSIE